MKSSIFAVILMMTLSIQAQMTNVQKIVDKCIEMHGGKAYNKAHYSYDFRKHSYEFHYNKGLYKYVRLDKNKGTKDVLKNEGFYREKNGEKVDLTAKQKNSFSNSVNSVNYFAFLPFFLNDASVNKRLLGTSEIKGEAYYKIEVTFNKEGGGDDHDDVYIYWINLNEFTLDYLAYSFHVDGGGVRFRSAFNRRKVGDIMFQDYENYKHATNFNVSEMDELYSRNELTLLSKIELKNIQKI